MRHGEEDHTLGLAERFVERAFADQAHGGIGGFDFVDRFVEQGLVKFLAGISDAGAADESAHRVTDDDHAVEFFAATFAAGVGAGLVHQLAEFHAAVDPRISGRIIVEPDLIVFAEPWFGREFVDDILERVGT